MTKKVSADNISELSKNAGFSGSAKGAPPTPQEMIEQIRAALKARVESLAQSAAAAKAAETDPAAPPSAFEISHQRALKSQRNFELLAANVPKGFRLTPVLYSKIEHDHNDQVYDEFKKEVRRNFLKYVAAHHADELARLGICPHGLERMKKGLDPADENDMLYEVNIDHIIERSGGGKMSLQKAPDPLQPGSGKTYLVNHFDNLILLPEHVHEAKNMLNDAQQAAQTPYGDSKWVLMLIPETGPAQSGFVAAPQDQTHYLHGLNLRQQDAAKRISHASFVADQLQQALQEFRQNPGIDGMLKTAESVAVRQQKTVVNMMQEEEKSGAVKKPSLKDVFNAAVAKSPAQKDMLENSVKPVMNDVARQIKAAFDEVSARPGANDENYRNFIHFYQGKKIGGVRQGIENLPLEEAARLSETFQQLDLRIKQRSAGPRLP
ncbi:MAG: hypothetical protein K8R48_07860 [Alphaproteobacteria bacterium]|nr:hypothetical protein [Alphaproteobacteria bacterium]